MVRNKGVGLLDLLVTHDTCFQFCEHVNQVLLKKPFLVAAML